MLTFSLNFNNSLFGGDLNVPVRTLLYPVANGLTDHKHYSQDRNYKKSMEYINMTDH